jgi:hypothetical protein
VKFGYASKEYVRQNNYPCVIFFDGTGVWTQGFALVK